MIDSYWKKAMKFDRPIDCMANIKMVIAMSNYIHALKEQTYTMGEIKEQYDKCWKVVLKERGEK